MASARRYGKCTQRFLSTLLRLPAFPRVLEEL